MMQKQLSEFVLLLPVSDGILCVATVTCPSERKKPNCLLSTVCLQRHMIMLIYGLPIVPSVVTRSV